jgi:hypothetical protein
VVLVDETVAIVVFIVHRSVVDVVVRATSIAETREKRSGGAKRSPPLELIVSIQIYSVAPLINLFIDVWDWRAACMGVVA